MFLVLSVISVLPLFTLKNEPWIWRRIFSDLVLWEDAGSH